MNVNVKNIVGNISTKYTLKQLLIPLYFVINVLRNDYDEIYLIKSLIPIHSVFYGDVEWWIALYKYA